LARALPANAMNSAESPEIPLAADVATIQYYFILLLLLLYCYIVLSSTP
jgi:hypothetical protein